jgi:hypothetical protein
MKTGKSFAEVNAIEIPTLQKFGGREKATKFGSVTTIYQFGHLCAAY